MSVDFAESIAAEAAHSTVRLAMEPDDMKTNPLQYDIIRDEAAFLALRDEWDALWRSAHGPYYQSFDVCWLAWQEVARPRGRKLLCIVKREAGKLVLAWPLVSFKRQFWTYVVPLGPDAGDYTSVLVEDGPYTAAQVEGAWRVARRHCGADFVHMPYMKEHTALYRAVSREPNVLFAEQHPSWVAQLRGEASWESFCADIGRRHRKKPGQRERRLAKEGDLAVRMLEPSDTTEIASLVDWMLECKRGWSDRTDKRGEWLHSPYYRNFLVRLLSPDAGAAMARIVAVSLDGRPVATTIISGGNPCASAIIAGFDAQFGRFGPGKVSMEHCVKWALENRFDVDFGVGDEDFKSYWSRDNVASAYTMQVIVTQWGTLAVRASHALQRIRQRVKAIRNRATDDHAAPAPAPAPALNVNVLDDA